MAGRMTKLDREAERLVTGDWIDVRVSGLGESILLEDVENRFRGWRNVQHKITPGLAWDAIAHAEAGGFRSPGDAPVVFGLAQAGIPAGSPEAEQIYNRAHTAASNAGRDWDAPDPNDPWAKVRQIAEERAAANTAAFEAGELDYSGGVSHAPGRGGVSVDPAKGGMEGNFSLWSAVKGTSRWAFLALDAIPEGIDALGRAITHVKAGNLSPLEAAGGMVGLDQEAGQLVGVPLFQYLAAGLRDERLNMGQGFFAEGQIAPEIESALARYDRNTNGVRDPVTGEVDDTPARQLFEEQMDRNGGEVIIPGPGGENYRTTSFEEWQFLRNNVGRAALLGEMQYNSPNQAALGQAHGTFNESVFDEGVAVRTKFDPLTGGSNQRHIPSFGRTPMALAFEGRSNPHDILSAPLDLGKQLMDLGAVASAAGVTFRRGGTILNKGKKFIGQGDESGKLIRGSETAKKVIGGADGPAVDNVIGDLSRQTINREAATNALARGADTELTAAKTFTAAVMRHAPGVLNARRQRQVANLVADGVEESKAVNMVGETLSENQIRNLVRRAANGDQPAQAWVRDVVAEAPNPATAEDAMLGIENMRNVTARGGVDLVDGRFGRAMVDDATYDAARKQVDELGDLLEGRDASMLVTDRAKAVVDPDQGLILSFDADLGRAQSTLARLYDDIADMGRPKTTYTADEAAQARRSWAQDSRPIQEDILPMLGLGEESIYGVSPQTRRQAEVLMRWWRDTASTTRGLVRSVNLDEVRAARQAGVGGKFDLGMASADKGEFLARQVNKGPKGWDQSYGWKVLFDNDTRAAKNVDNTVAGEPEWLVSGRFTVKEIDEATKTIRVGDQSDLLSRALGKPRKLLSDEQIAGQQQALVQNLFNERWISKRWAEKALGDTDDASREVSNLMRVLRRNEDATDLVNHADEFSRILPEGKIRDLLTGGGAMTDMADSLIDANTMAKVDDILGPSKEFFGRTIHPQLKKQLAEATTRADVVDAFIRAGSTARLLPQKIGLLGRYARAGTVATSAGAVAGGVMGATEGVSGLEDPGIADYIGGALSGAIMGGLAGSAMVGPIAKARGQITRNIDGVGDALDLLLAGTRSTTADILRARGVDVGRAQAGFSAPQLLTYGFGHGSWGRRLARGHRSTVNINDPFDMYYTLHDMVRGFGVRADDKVTLLERGVGASTEWDRIARNAYDSDEAYRAAIDEAISNGYKPTQEFDLDNAFRRLADLQANNPAEAYVAMRELFTGLENLMVAKGLNPELAKSLSRFATEHGDEFIGNVNAIGEGANYAQGMVVNGVHSNLQDAPLLMSEMWSGNVRIPPPDKVHRAMLQLDTLGKITTAFTGAGVKEKAWRKLRGRMPESQWSDVITPQKWDELERNTTMTMARNITGKLWAPAVLLTRPIAFISRVLGEDQMRMTAEGLDSLFHHPFNYLTAVATDIGFKNVRPRGVTARSLIPDDLFDESGKLVEDALDRMHHLEVSERVQQGLGIYNPDEATANKIFGQTHWTTINKGNPAFKRAVADEVRQLVNDPILRYMAGSTADDVVDDTMRWLMESAEGKKVMARWTRQFSGRPDKAALFLDSEDALRGFLSDAHARLHLKTGGDWFYVFDQGGTKVGITADGKQLDPVRSGINLDDYDAGYHLIRGGDPEILDVVAKGKLPEDWLSKVNDEAVLAGKETFDGLIAGQLNERRLEELRNYIANKHDAFERGLKTQAADESFHRFPQKVKGTRSISDIAPKFAKWDDALDRTYDYWLGKPTNWFSRQPTLGQYYWERVGLMLPSMSDEVATKFRSLAEAEGMLERVNRIADELDDVGMARGIIDDFDMMDLNAKAYAVERTKDILFDLTRQRNFIDGLRVVAPFAGPLTEALEAWGRVARGNPVWLWRRGGQAINHIWDTDPLATQEETGFGTFWVNEDGEEMFTFPFSGPVMSWMHNNISEHIPTGPITGRARGLNVVFGPEDLADPDQPTFAGAPVSALNPGQGPAFSVPVHMFLKDSEGALRTFYDEVFPYGAPSNPLEATLPYHLRKAFEGFLGKSSRAAQVRTAGEQFNAMVAAGLLGDGDSYEYNINEPGEVKKAWEEALSRGRWAGIVQGVLRGSLPTMVTPDVYEEIPDLKEAGVDTDRLMNISALQEEARALFSPEGAEVITTADGTEVSTEGNWQAITEVLNQRYGLDIFSAELLTMSPSNTVHPRQFTERGGDWMRTRGDEIAHIAPNSVHLLMPGYAEGEDEEFDPRAREDAIRRGDTTYEDVTQYDAEIQSRLLSIRNRQIDQLATQLFGPDDILEGEDQDSKDVWVSEMKQQAKGIHERAVIPVSSTQKTLDELLTWDQRDWDEVELTPEERDTVQAMLWYLEMENYVMSYAQGTGLTKVTNKGSNETQRQAGRAARNDLLEVVRAQLEYSAENGHNLGNFPYLWKRYLKPRLEEVEDEEPDPFMQIAENMSPYGLTLDELREDG